MSAKRLGLALAGVAAAGVLALVVALVVGALSDDSQSKVEAHRGDTPAPVASLNRSDDAGADTLRAYLQAALACTRVGERVMAQLSRPAEREVRDIFRARCARNGNRPWSDSLTGELDPDELDQRGQALWAVSADGDGLPNGMHIRIR